PVTSGPASPPSAMWATDRGLRSPAIPIPACRAASPPGREAPGASAAAGLPAAPPRASTRASTRASMRVLLLQRAVALRVATASAAMLLTVAATAATAATAEVMVAAAVAMEADGDDALRLRARSGGCGVRRAADPALSCARLRRVQGDRRARRRQSPDRRRRLSQFRSRGRCDRDQWRRDLAAVADARDDRAHVSISVPADRRADDRARHAR